MPGLDPLFASRIEAALAAAEKATGARRIITDTYRDPMRQAQYYANYSGRTFQYQGQTFSPNGPGGVAAKPPGFEGARGSMHQRGLAMDLGAGPVRDWVRAHAGEYGLETLDAKGVNDPPHIQLAGAGTPSGAGGVTGPTSASSGATPAVSAVSASQTPMGTLSDMLAHVTVGAGGPQSTGLPKYLPPQPAYNLQTTPVGAEATPTPQAPEPELSPLADLFGLPSIGASSGVAADGTPLPGALPGQAKSLRRSL